MQPFCRNQQLGCAHPFCSWHPLYIRKWGAQSHLVNWNEHTYVVVEPRIISSTPPVVIGMCLVECQLQHHHPKVVAAMQSTNDWRKMARTNMGKLVECLNFRHHPPRSASQSTSRKELICTHIFVVRIQSSDNVNIGFSDLLRTCELS